MAERQGGERCRMEELPPLSREEREHNRWPRPVAATWPFIAVYATFRLYHELPAGWSATAKVAAATLFLSVFGVIARFLWRFLR